MDPDNLVARSIRRLCRNLFRQLQLCRGSSCFSKLSYAIAGQEVGTSHEVWGLLGFSTVTLPIGLGNSKLNLQHRQPKSDRFFIWTGLALPRYLAWGRSTACPAASGIGQPTASVGVRRCSRSLYRCSSEDHLTASRSSARPSTIDLVVDILRTK